MEKGEDSKGDLRKLEGDVRRQRATRQAFKIEAKDRYDVTWAGWHLVAEMTFTNKSPKWKGR